jgi:hypothetical protein
MIGCVAEGDWVLGVMGLSWRFGYGSDLVIVAIWLWFMVTKSGRKIQWFWGYNKILWLFLTPYRATNAFVVISLILRTKP